MHRRGQHESASAGLPLCSVTPHSSLPEPDHPNSLTLFSLFQLQACAAPKHLHGTDLSSHKVEPGKLTCDFWSLLPDPFPLGSPAWDSRESLWPVHSWLRGGGRALGPCLPWRNPRAKLQMQSPRTHHHPQPQAWVGKVSSHFCLHARCTGWPQA